jgi:hypothetical protein
MEASAVEKLEALGVGGILRQLAKDGQLLDVAARCPSATATAAASTRQLTREDTVNYVREHFR